jgi:Flp pilus assembly pilin Flp
MFQRIWRDQRGASLIEYSILAALIAVLLVVVVAVAGSWLYSMWVHLLSLLGYGLKRLATCASAVEGPRD